jgi:hypothetical protein
MVLEQWEIQPSTKRCAKTGVELAEGDVYYGVLFEEGEGFRREDYALSAWDGPPDGAFCHFRTRVPVKEKKQQLLVDDEILLEFFIRLASEEQELKVHFRFVLALILMRKRLLKYGHTEHDEAREYWVMRLARQTASGSAEKDSVHRVYNPNLDDGQIEAVSKELSAILHGGMLEEADEVVDSAGKTDDAQTHG